MKESEELDESGLSCWAAAYLVWTAASSVAEAVMSSFDPGLLPPAISRKRGSCSLDRSSTLPLRLELHGGKQMATTAGTQIFRTVLVYGLG